MEPKWQSIETAPTDFTVFMVAWPHSQMDGGWFFDFWAGKHLLDVRKAYDEGLDKLSPHMWQMPTHWQPLPAAPDATNTHPPATDVAALVEAAKEVSDRAFMTYRRNGRDHYIEDDSGEGCMIVPHDAWNALRAALAPFTKGQNDD